MPYMKIGKDKYKNIITKEVVTKKEMQDNFKRMKKNAESFKKMLKE